MSIVPIRQRLQRILIANRGEIVLRVARTAAARGMSWVAVYTAADAGQRHVALADEAVEIPGYLDAAALVEAALRTGCDSVHPGYGFLSEDAGFARAVEEVGLVWVGPPASVIEQMGDKIRAKAIAAAAGVPVVPGGGRPGMDDAELMAAALEVGLPILIKPSAGGGGKGMHRVERAEELAPAIAAAHREAAGAFGDATLLIERYVERPRHLEVQVFADTHGNVVHLGTRECSLQRRHQKIVEETPSPALEAKHRAAIFDSALAVTRAVGYVGAGTVEFVVPAGDPSVHYFLEMNTRLQVEHPVTEAVTGLDLVDWQLRVAAGETLPCRQDQVEFVGHAVEARLYAEDPSRGFLPATGRIVSLRQPDGLPGIRIDTALAGGVDVGTRFDPMLGKVIAWGEDRAQAFDRLHAALVATSVLGVTTNVGFLGDLVVDPEVRAGHLDTDLVDRVVRQLAEVAPAPATELDPLLCAALALASAGAQPESGPWDMADGWRLGGRPAPRVVSLIGPGSGATPRVVEIRGDPVHCRVRVDGGADSELSAVASQDGLVLQAGGVSTRWDVAIDDAVVWVGRQGRTWRYLVPGPQHHSVGPAATTGGVVTSPMPGQVVAVHVAPGERVEQGAALVSVEAMKMEYAVRAPMAGTVSEIRVRVGQQVAMDEPLAEVTASDDRQEAVP